MSEANQNDTSFDAKSVLQNENNPLEQQNEVAETVSQPIVNNRSLSSFPSNYAVASAENRAEEENSASLSNKMNWQRVAHKLRDYNRKLTKKVIRLEEELAEIDNKFNKYVEKSQNSDLLLAHQAEEIKNYQEKFALLTQQLFNSQQLVENQELIIKQISEQHELSQKQAAQLERECTLLQEKYNHKAFELVAKEQEAQELQSKLSQQERNDLQREAELKRYQNAATSRKQKASRNQNYPHNRFIQPWSNSAIPEPKIPLPKAKSQPSVDRSIAKAKDVETIKTAAEIAAWSATKNFEPKQDLKKAQSGQHKKPQSLAAVDLPTFPRPN